MKCELCCDDNCLDLPSLTEIQGNRYDGIHRYMGYVKLESMIWFDLIWYDMIRHSKSHWKQHSLWKIFILLHCRFASNKYFSISFPFSRFRCSCSRKSHSRKVEDFNRKKRKILLFHFLRNPSLSLAERRKRKSSLSLSKSLFVFLCCLSVICLLTVKITIQPIQSRGSFIQFKKYEK